MIDRTKNLCYIVTVDYFIKNGVGEIKKRQAEFISLHSISTEKCKKFAKSMAYRDKQFLEINEQDWWISQRTIPLTDLCK